MSSNEEHPLPTPQTQATRQTFSMQHGDVISKIEIILILKSCTKSYAIKERMCKIRWLTRWKEIKKGYKKQYKIMVKISGLKMKMDSLNDVLK